MYSVQRAKSPSPELYHEPSVARAGERGEGDAGLAAQRHTASRMINVFRQMEESRREEPQGRDFAYVLFLGFRTHAPNFQDITCRVAEFYSTLSFDYSEIKRIFFP